MEKSLMKSLKEAISNVLETMFYQPVQIADENLTLQDWFSQERSLVGARLTFTGPITGLLYLIVPGGMAEEITANFLGLKEGEINQNQKQDTVKEALNMICGHMLSLADQAGAYRLGIPEVMGGLDAEEGRFKGFNGNDLFLETEDGRLATGMELD